MKNTSVLGRFLLWRIKHISQRNFIMILSVIIGVTAGLGAVVIKNGVHLIKDLLTSVRLGGRRVVKSVYTKDEIFDGPHSGIGPELVVLPEDGFSFKTGLFSKQLTTVDKLLGRHTEDDAFLYLKDADSLDEFTHLESALLALRTQYGGLNL